MTFAHLSAGYITCRLLKKKLEPRITSYPNYLFWGMLGAVVPDLDYLYMFLLDPHNYDHHRYITHFPLFWATLLTGSWIWLLMNKTGSKPLLFFIFSLNGFIHMILDTVEGLMFWLAPFSYQGFSGMIVLMKYAARFVDSYPYWHFGIEGVIIVWSIMLFSGELLHKKKQTEN